MATINIHEAKIHFSKLLERVVSGEEIVITEANKPIAVLSPYQSKSAPRVPGIDAGKVVINADFDEQLQEFDY